MSTIGWIVLVILIVPAIGLLLWVLLSASILRIPSDQIGLLLVRGRPTDTTLGPGWHFVPALFKRLVERYPAVEMTYRAGADPEIADRLGLDCTGPEISLITGDRVTAVASLTVRFRLIPERLRLVHERFGPGGYFGIVRDEATAALRSVVGDEQVRVDELFGNARTACEERIARVLAERLAADGVELRTFLLGAVDLGRTGEVIQAISRARHEQEQEDASSATRLARARNDARLTSESGLPPAKVWQYREAEYWREMARRSEHLHLSMSDNQPNIDHLIQPDGDPGRTDPLGDRTADRPKATEPPA